MSVSRIGFAALTLWTTMVVSQTLADDTAEKSATTLQASVDRLAKPYLDDHRVVGMVIGILQKDKPSVFGYGTMSTSDERVPDGDTVFEIGSVTKVFTGVLLADAVVRKVVTLEDSLGKWLPADVGEKEYESRPIRLLDLSTHVSGLPRLPANLQSKDEENPYADYRVDDLFAFLKDYELEQVPGSKFEYSNLGQGLLGVLLSRAQSKTYEELLTSRITKPLKMTSTTIRLSDAQRRRLAPPHTVDRELTKNWDLPALAGAGAIRSTVDDMLRFSRACLSPPDSELGQAIELGWKIHQPAIAKDDFAMGLGWHIARDGATRWHNGQTGGYHSIWLVNRDIQTAVVLLTNTATADVDTLAQDVMRMVAGAKVTPRTFEQTVTVAPEVMKRYVGTFQLAPNARFTVSAKDGRLLVRLTGQPTFEVYPRSETEWFYKVVEATITFKVDDVGKCTALELFQNGARLEAKRVK